MIKILKYGEVTNDEIFARSVPEVDVAGIVSDIIATVRARGDARIDKADAVRIICMLHHDGGVCAGGQHPAGRDLRALTSFQRKRGSFAHGDFSDDSQFRRERRPRAEGVGGNDGVAVNGRAVKRRDVLCRDDILRQHAAQRLLQTDCLCARRHLFHLFAHTGSRLRFGNDV